MDTMAILKKDPMALASGLDQSPAYKKFVQEGIDRWHKKRAEEKEMADGRRQTAAEEKTTETQS